MDKYENNRKDANTSQSRTTGDPKEEMIRVDGRGQVLQLLRYVDPAYREFLLRSIERRDPRLARELRRDL